jgi:RIO-like serine/threonine protein kinase
LWVDKNNPNRDKLVKALRDMSKDPESISAIEKDTGKYEWVVGDDVNKAMNALEKMTTKKALKDLVWWTSVVVKQDAYYKEEIAIKAK